MIELRDTLVEEVAQRQSLLNAREREILKNHLVGEVAMHLHDRLRAAEELDLREMNEELKAAPISTGMTLRFTWEPIVDGPPGLAEARKRLLAAGGTWSPQDRESLGTFYSNKSKRSGGQHHAGTWQEHLTTVSITAGGTNSAWSGSKTVSGNGSLGERTEQAPAERRWSR